MARGNECQIEVYGLHQFVMRHKKELPQAMKDLRKAHRQTGNIILKATRANIQAQKGPRSAQGGRPPNPGALKMSYKTKAWPDKAEVGSKLVYAGVSEFGGSIPRKGHKGQADLGHIRGAKRLREKYNWETRVEIFGRTLHKPKADTSYYTYPAIEETRAKWSEFYQREVKEIYERHRIQF